MWMANILKRDWPKIARTTEYESKDLYTMLEEKLSGLAIKRNHIYEATKKAQLNPDKPATWNEQDFLKFVDTLRQIAKPMLIAANKMDIPTAEQNLERLKKLNYIVVPCCSEAELALRRATEKQLIDYKPGDCNFKINNPEKLTETQTKALETIREKVLLKHGSTGVQEAVNTAFSELLSMITVYPVEDLEHLADHNGRVLPDAYLVPYGTTARQLAYIIHTELGEGFIYAVEARERKRIGEDYTLKDRDIISIVSAKKRA
jgi:ribosome-binding ATPase YchF (GTP1/OBG family)